MRQVIYGNVITSAALDVGSSVMASASLALDLDGEEAVRRSISPGMQLITNQYS